MMDKIQKEKLFIYVLYLILYLVVPIIIRDTGSAIIILLCIHPLITFLISSIYGYRYSFDFLYPISVGILFIPSIYIYYNESAWIYVFGYLCLAFIGEAFGFAIRKFVHS